VQQKIKKTPTVTRVVSSRRKVRRLVFEAEPWYAEAVRRISAARKPEELQEVVAAPLAPD
jgi:hypothetical protein